MRIGVLSDTHGGLKSWKEIMGGVFSQVDLVIHAGDVFYHGTRNLLPEQYDTISLAQEINHVKIPLIVCRGNCDSEVDQVVVDLPIQSPYVFCQFDGLRMLVHHGHLFTEEDVARLASRWNFGVCISGHTHIPSLMQKRNVVFLNPGSPASPKGKGIPTVGLIETKKGKCNSTEISILDYLNNRVIERLEIPEHYPATPHFENC